MLNPAQQGATTSASLRAAPLLKTQWRNGALLVFSGGAPMAHQGDPIFPSLPARPKRHEVEQWRTDPPDPPGAAASQEVRLLARVKKAPRRAREHEGDLARRRRDAAAIFQATRSAVHRRDQQISSVRSMMDRTLVR